MSRSSLSIGIDARLLKLRRGMGNYVHSLLHEFSRSNVDYRIIAYVDDEAVLKQFPSASGLHFQVIKPSFYPVCEQFALPRQAAKDGIDILHCPANTAPIQMPISIKLVLTIHDIMYLLPRSILPESPSMYQQLGRRYRSWVVPQVARSAAAVITVSHFSKQDILSHLQLPAGKISVIHEAQGQDVGRSTDQAIEKVIDDHCIRRPYFFALGAIDPRKNTARVIQAFAKFIKSTGVQHMLVLSGLPGTAREPFLKLAESEGVASLIQFLPFVSREELIALYSGAEMLLFPSLYEGFGFPVLEAMSCGTPVITSAVTSIPELAGDAALFVDPYDKDSITQAMKTLAFDQNLRIDLSQKGLIQSHRFSWRQAALETLQVYERVAYAS